MIKLKMKNNRDVLAAIEFKKLKVKLKDSKKVYIGEWSDETDGVLELVVDSDKDYWTPKYIKISRIKEIEIL